MVAWTGRNRSLRILVRRCGSFPLFSKIQELTGGVLVFAQSNVFTLAFSCDSTKLFSAGNDERIRCHDIETGSSTNRLPYQVWNDHDAGVRSIAAHPKEPFIFMSARCVLS